MKTGKRTIRDGSQFERFFRRPKGKTITVKKEANLKDTMKWIPVVIKQTLNQTKSIANYLQADNVKETCRRIWNFCFHHFQYKRDEQRKEQLRTPYRSWHDRGDEIGIDCDCFSIFIGSILTNLGIPFFQRLTYYEKQDDFSHIYPVALAPNGEEIIIDCVTHQFNYEVPYKVKKDEHMELEILNGTPVSSSDEIVQDTFVEHFDFDNDLPIDAQDLFLDADLELEGLEGRAERQARKAARKAKRNRPPEVKKAERKVNRKAFVKNFKEGSLKDKVRAVAHIANKVNPATLLLRAGILASMKVNLFKVASTLRFAYWTVEEARKNKMDLGKLSQLQRIRQRLEKIYFGAGGKPEALKKAILTGKGNRNSMVRLNGLGEIIQSPEDEDSLIDILGDDLFYGELNGFEGLEGLGEPTTIATGAAITAASAVIGTIAGLIKKIGPMFKKGTEAAQKFEIQDNTDNENEKKRKFSFKNVFNTVRSKIQERRQAKSAGEGNADQNTDLQPLEPLPEEPFELDDNFDPTGDGDIYDTRSADDSDKKKGFKAWIDDNKVLFWSGVGLGGAGLLGLTYYLVKRSKKKKGGKSVNGLEGASKKSTKTKTKSKAKSKTTKRKSTNRKTTTRKKFVPRSRGRRKATTKTVKRVRLL